MQEQEGIPQSQQQAVNHVINTDPREQQADQETYGYDYERSYDEGYSGPHMDDMRARAREKLQPKLSVRWQGLDKLIGLLVVVVVFMVAIYLLGLLTSWLLWLALTAGVTVATFLIITNWRVVSVPMPVATFQVSESSQLVINNAIGAITLRRGEPGVVSVAATKKASGVGVTEQKVQEQYQKIQYQQQDRQLRVSTKISWNLFELVFRSIALEITVPDHCDIVVRDGSGHLIVQGVRGNMQLQTGSGKMTINDVRGQIEAKTGSGQIAVNDVHGQIEAKTGSGRVEASQVDGSLQLRTGSGRITVQRSQLRIGSILKTGSGSISFDGSLGERGDYQFSTGSGSIGVRLPWNASFRLQAKTGSGPIVNEFASTQGDPDVGAQLKLKTGSGGIIVSRGAMV